MMYRQESATPTIGRGERKHIPVLDGVRGLAILLVLCNHFGAITPGTRLDAAYRAAVNFGWSGVNLFFVLSGFLITGILIDARNKPHYFRNFYARRTLRIFPLYYGTLACVWLGMLAARQPQVAHLGWYWAYGSNVVQTLAWSPVASHEPVAFSHFWSLAVEEHFYLAWPLLIYVTGRRGRYLLCGACLAAGPVCRVLAWKLTHNPVGAYVLTPCRTDGLAMGGLLAIAMRDEVVLAALAKHRRLLWPVALLAVAGLAGVLVWSGDAAWYRRHTEVIGFTLVDLLAALTILGLLLAGPGHLANRALSARWLRSVGKYSYGIYILHDIVGPPVVEPIMRRLNAIPPLAHCPSAVPGSVVAIALGTAVAYGAAWLSYQGFERHFLRLKSRFETVRAPASSADEGRSVGPFRACAAAWDGPGRRATVVATVKPWPRKSSATRSTT